MRFTSHIFSWPALITLLLISGADAQPTYTLTELSLGGGWGTAVGLKEAGQVTGRSHDAQGNGQVFLYDPSAGIQQISLGGTWGVASAISETGQVVGYSQNATGGQSAFVYSPEDLSLPFVGTRSPESAWVKYFNQKGQIAGTFINSDDETHAFLYDSEQGLQEISLGGTQGGDNGGDVFGINEKGQVIGWSKNHVGDAQAFVYDATHGIMQLSLGGTSGYGLDVNEAGQVVGSSDNTGGTQAFIHDPINGIRELSLGGAYGQARKINETGQVIGLSTNAADQPRAFFLRSDHRNPRAHPWRQLE